MKAYKAMLKTELKLSLRGMDMLIFAIIMPLVVLVVLGIIYGNKPAFEGATYAFIEQSFGALSIIAICAGGVMGLPLVVSDYRGKQILKRFKVTPVSPGMILIVEVTIYFLYALVSLLTLFAVAVIFFGFRMWEAFYNSFLDGCWYDFDVQHRYDGWRHCKKRKSSRNHRKCVVLPDADFFRGDTPL